MKSPFVIAEMACAHDGSLELASKIVQAAYEASANAVQFQIWQPSECVAPNHKDFELLTGIDLGYDGWTALIEKSRTSYPNLQIIACVYGITSAKFAASLGIDVFKIHGSDLGNTVLLETCAKLGRRIDLSIGGSLDHEIEEAIETIRTASGGTAEIWLMYGIQLFPTPIEDLNISRMRYLAEKFECTVGFQDHSDPESHDGFAVPAAVLMSGISVVEKHITHDRKKKGIDSQAALNPDEFKDFVSLLNQLSNCATLGNIGLTEGEKRYREYSKKQILAATNLEIGHVISADDLLFSRPANFEEDGFQPNESGELIGKVLRRTTPAFSPLTKEGVAP